jgi:hypothetical protein
MKREELKKMLKPLIKECIKEVIFEQGTLSTIISEVVKSTSTQQVFAESQAKPRPVSTGKTQRLETSSEARSRRDKKLSEHKKKLMKSIGKGAYNGVNIFEGTTPAPATNSNHGSKSLDGVAPGDAGVDLSSLGVPTGIWKKIAGN